MSGEALARLPRRKQNLEMFSLLESTLLTATQQVRRSHWTAAGELGGSDHVTALVPLVLYQQISLEYGHTLCLQVNVALSLS